MGFKSSEWAYSITIPKGPQASAQRAVLAALAHCRHDQTGRCNPGYARLVKMTDLSRATIKRALDGLADLGYIERNGVLRGGVRIGTSYRLKVDVDAPEPVLTVTPAHGEHTYAHGEHTYAHGEPTPVLTVDPPCTHGEPQKGTQEIQVSQEENTSAFDRFYEIWPRKVGKPDARKAWDKVIKTTPSSQIIWAAVAYRDNPARPPKQFIPHPATWLNREGWNDELDAPAEIDRRTSTPTRNERNLALVAEIARQQNADQRGISA